MSKWTDEQADSKWSEIYTDKSYTNATRSIARMVLDLEAELAAMRPVVEAAEAWRTSDYGIFGNTLSALNAAVDAYRAQREGK